MQKTTERYDVATNQWRLMPPLNCAREAAFGCAVGDKLYVGAGGGEIKMYCSIEVFDVTTIGTDEAKW